MTKKNKVAKKTDFVHDQCYLQVNFAKGFEYIDRAGKIVNHYSNDEGKLKFSMSTEGLIIEMPVPKVAELRITPHDIWLKFIEPKLYTLDEITSIFEKEVDFISKTLGLTEFTRLGWRNFFVYEKDKIGLSNEIVASHFKVPTLNPVEITGNLTTSDKYKATLFIKVVNRIDRKTKEPIEGIAIDIDLFSEKKVKTKDIHADLVKMARYFKSDDFSVIVNSIINMSK